jgi:DNA polymerase-3 subunit epsilon
MTLKEATFVAFDTETTGRYPVESEICEIAAVKYLNGKQIDQFESLVKPIQKMSEAVIEIHHITNEMVADAPPIDQVIRKFVSFLGDAHVVAHHAPFDLGFTIPEMEKLYIPLPKGLVFCSSIISRMLINSVPNHRLQTLADHLKLPERNAHRALDDAIACWHVFDKCVTKFGPEKNCFDLYKAQKADLSWARYSLTELAESNANAHKAIIAAKEKRRLEINYKEGTVTRIIQPLGIVRNPKGDFVAAMCEREWTIKRFYLNRILSARLLE